MQRHHSPPIRLRCRSTPGISATPALVRPPLPILETSRPPDRRNTFGDSAKPGNRLPFQFRNLSSVRATHRAWSPAQRTGDKYGLAQLAALRRARQASEDPTQNPRVQRDNIVRSPTASATSAPDVVTSSARSPLAMCPNENSRPPFHGSIFVPSRDFEEPSGDRPSRRVS